jgi:hypothetical protein
MGTETDIMCQFLGPEIVTMGQHSFWPKKLTLWESFWAKKLTLLESSWAQKLTLWARNTLWVFKETFQKIKRVYFSPKMRIINKNEGIIKNECFI